MRFNTFTFSRSLKQASMMLFDGMLIFAAIAWGALFEIAKLVLDSGYVLALSEGYDL